MTWQPVYLIPVLALAACGGGKVVERPRLSPAALVAEANRICASTEAGPERHGRLAALRPPMEKEELFDSLLAADHARLEAAGDLLEAERQGKTEDAEADRLRVLVNEGKATGYARRLGAARCTIPE